jgi:hypothetical protein
MANARTHRIAPTIHRQVAAAVAQRRFRITEEAITHSHEYLETFAQRYPRAMIVMETGTHSPWMSRLFEARSHRVLAQFGRRRPEEVRPMNVESCGIALFPGVYQLRDNVCHRGSP